MIVSNHFCLSAPLLFVTCRDNELVIIQSGHKTVKASGRIKKKVVGGGGDTEAPKGGSL